MNVHSNVLLKMVIPPYIIEKDGFMAISGGENKPLKPAEQKKKISKLASELESLAARQVGQSVIDKYVRLSKRINSAGAGFLDSPYSYTSEYLKSDLGKFLKWFNSEWLPSNKFSKRRVNIVVVSHSNVMKSWLKKFINKPDVMNNAIYKVTFKGSKMVGKPTQIFKGYSGSNDAVANGCLSCLDEKVQVKCKVPDVMDIVSKIISGEPKSKEVIVAQFMGEFRVKELRNIAERLDANPKGDKKKLIEKILNKLHYEFKEDPAPAPVSSVIAHDRAPAYSSTISPGPTPASSVSAHDRARLFGWARTPIELPDSDNDIVNVIMDFMVKPENADDFNKNSNFEQAMLLSDIYVRYHNFAREQIMINDTPFLRMLSRNCQGLAYEFTLGEFSLHLTVSKSWFGRLASSDDETITEFLLGMRQLITGTSLENVRPGLHMIPMVFGVRFSYKPSRGPGPGINIIHEVKKLKKSHKR